MALVSPIGEPGAQADASASSSWVEAELIANVRFARAMFVLGGGSGRTSFRRTDGMTEGPIFSDDSWLAGRLGGGLGVSPVRFGSVRPVGYVLYNINGGSHPNQVNSTLELGVDVEIDQRLSNRTASVFKVGAAIIRESGSGSARLGGISTLDGEFESTGFLVTFGWHFSLERFSE